MCSFEVFMLGQRQAALRPASGHYAPQLKRSHGALGPCLHFTPGNLSDMQWDFDLHPRIPSLTLPSVRAPTCAAMAMFGSVCLPAVHSRLCC